MSESIKPPIQETQEAIEHINSANDVDALSDSNLNHQIIEADDIQSDDQYKARHSGHEKAFTAKNMYAKAKQAAVLASVGGGLALTLKEYAPNPAVSSAGTDALIGVNEALREAGPTALIALAAVSGTIAVARARSVRVKEMLESTKPVAGPKEKNWSRKILPPLIVAATAVGTGLGGEAGHGANEPIDAIVQMMGANPATTYAVVSNKDVLPFNYSAVDKTDATKIANWAALHDRMAAPFYMELGSAKNPHSNANPSSAGIIALPSSLIPKSVSNVKNLDGEMTVMTTKQFAKKGEHILVEDKPAVVGATTDTYPGLDRTAIITSIEDLSKEVLRKDEPPFGVMVSGISSQKELNDFLKEQGIDAAAIPVEEWQKSYDKFWDRSVTPLSMEFMLLIAGIGSVGASYMRTTDILRRRRDLATQNIMGVDKHSESRAEYLRSAVDAMKATAYAAAPTIGVLAVTNSAQYGVSLEASPAGLGAGAILVGGSLFASTFAASRMIKKMDSVNEVR